MLAQIRDIAFGDVRTLFKSDGTLKPLQDLSDEAVALIASFEVDGVSTKKVRIMDRLRALELLAKNLGLLKDQLHLTIGDEIEKRLEAGRQRAAENNAKQRG